jgi:hypothetical protein
MINKKSEKGKCPFRKLKACSEECVFYRKGVRYKENSDEAFPFEDCAFNIIADNLEAMHNRTYMMQKEVGETKNVMALKVLVDLGKISSREVENTSKRILNLPTDDQLYLKDK